MRASAALMELAPAAAPPFELAVRVRSASGKAIAVEATATTRGKPPEDGDPSPDGVRFSIPAGVRYEVCLRAEDHVSIYRAGIAQAGGTACEDVVLPLQ
ncbi:MAG: hypothetical protein HOP15_09650 [Planctomycetes bacterium]|nr:hypothetical protein [Planctomycetota bacterium]